MSGGQPLSSAIYDRQAAYADGRAAKRAEFEGRMAAGEFKAPFEPTASVERQQPLLLDPALAADEIRAEAG